MGTNIAYNLITEDHQNPEQKLWRHVILNAVEDAQLINSDRKNSINKMKAHHWIMYENDFETHHGNRNQMFLFSFRIYHA